MVQKQEDVPFFEVNPESWTKNFRGLLCQGKKGRNMIMQTA